jgi:hypothetical protein
MLPLVFEDAIKHKTQLDDLDRSRDCPQRVGFEKMNRKGFSGKEVNGVRAKILFTQGIL